MLSRDVRGPWAERPFVGDTRTLGDCTVAAFTECRPRCTVVLLQPMAVSTAAHFRLRRAAAIPNQDPLPLVFPWPIESLAIGETAGRCHRRALEFSRKKKKKKVVPRLQTEREKKQNKKAPLSNQVQCVAKGSSCCCTPNEDEVSGRWSRDADLIHSFEFLLMKHKRFRVAALATPVSSAERKGARRQTPKIAQRKAASGYFHRPRFTRSAPQCRTLRVRIQIGGWRSDRHSGGG